MRKSLLAIALGVAVATLAGCSALRAPGIARGTAQADVQRSLGKPTDVRTVAGAPAWDYVTGPSGFETYRVSFDNANRVQRVEQLLTEQNFQKLVAGAPRDEVAARFGRPMVVHKFQRSDTEVWTYRYRDMTMQMLADVYMNLSSGRVQYVAMYRDPAYISSFSE